MDFPTSYLRFSSKILGITCKYFHFIKHIEEAFCGFTEGAEEETALLWPFSERYAGTGVMRNPRNKRQGEPVSGFTEMCLAYGATTPCKLNSSGQCQG